MFRPRKSTVIKIILGFFGAWSLGLFVNLLITQQGPQILSLEPTLVSSGDLVTLKGQNLGEDSRAGRLDLSGIQPPPSSIKYWSEKEIRFEVPPHFSGALVSVTTILGTSKRHLLISPGSLPKSFSPAAGPQSRIFSVDQKSSDSPGLWTLRGTHFQAAGPQSQILLYQEGWPRVLEEENLVSWDLETLVFRPPTGIKIQGIQVGTAQGWGEFFPLAEEHSLPGTRFHLELTLELPPTAEPQETLWLFPRPQPDPFAKILPDSRFLPSVPSFSQGRLIPVETQKNGSRILQEVWSLEVRLRSPSAPQMPWGGSLTSKPSDLRVSRPISAPADLVKTLSTNPKDAPLQAWSWLSNQPNPPTSGSPEALGKIINLLRQAGIPCRPWAWINLDLPTPKIQYLVLFWTPSGPLVQDAAGGTLPTQAVLLNLQALETGLPPGTRPLDVPFDQGLRGYQFGSQTPFQPKIQWILKQVKS